MAMGSTFCGVTGSSSIACRWDITGPPAVRAARLMQYAIKNDLEVAIDSSLLTDPMAASRMALLDTHVNLKGSVDPCTVYRLSGSQLYSVFRVMETTTGSAHHRVVQQVRKCINSRHSRCAVILTGTPFSGKREICLRAAALGGLVPFKHVCDDTAGLAQLARTIATWYSYADSQNIRDRAAKVLDHMNKKRWSRAHDECVNLVIHAVNEGLKACFVIDRIHFLDSFSLSIMRRSLQGKILSSGMRNNGKTVHRMSNTALSGTSSGSDIDGSCHGSIIGGKKAKGKIAFLGTHVSLYHHKTAEQIRDDITRSSRTFSVKVVEVGESTPEELRAFIQDECDVEVDDRWIRCHQEASGSNLQYMLRRAKAIREISDRDSGSIVRDVITRDLKLHIPSGYIENCRQFPVVHCSADITMKSAQIFDELPPLFQSVTKVLAIATRRGLFMVPTSVIKNVMDDLYGGLNDNQIKTIIKEMVEMYLVKTESSGGVDTVNFRAPSLGHVAMDVCTPNQIQTISSALVNRLGMVLNDNFRIPLLMALLSHDIYASDDTVNRYWRLGYENFVKESSCWTPGERNWWKERISDLVTSVDGNPTSLFGKDFSFAQVEEAAVPPQMKEIKSYVAPITFGPMGHTLSVISRSLFQDYGAHSRLDSEAKTKLRKAFDSAKYRYLKQVKELEEFLAKENLGATESQQQSEREMIEHLCSESTSAEEVCDKAEKFITELVESTVLPRLERLRMFVCKNGNGSNQPSVIIESNNKAIQAAYSRLKECKCWKDSTEIALMVLAVENWKPTPVPECESLPAFYYQTIVRIRDSVLKQQSKRDTDGSDRGYIYSFEDFQAFLIVTALLDKRPVSSGKMPPKSLSYELEKIDESESDKRQKIVESDLDKRESFTAANLNNPRTHMSHRGAMNFVSGSTIGPIRHTMSKSKLIDGSLTNEESVTSIDSAGDIHDKEIPSDRLEAIENRLEVVERFIRASGFQLANTYS